MEVLVAATVVVDVGGSVSIVVVVVVSIAAVEVVTLELVEAPLVVVVSHGPEQQPQHTRCEKASIELIVTLSSPSTLLLAVAFTSATLIKETFANKTQVKFQKHTLTNTIVPKGGEVADRKLNRFPQAPAMDAPFQVPFLKHVKI